LRPLAGFCPGASAKINQPLFADAAHGFASRCDILEIVATSKLATLGNPFGSANLHELALFVTGRRQSELDAAVKEISKSVAGLTGTTGLELFVDGGAAQISTGVVERRMDIG
jgi:hypothetical protein